jgi:hypothetical protein
MLSESAKLQLGGSHSSFSPAVRDSSSSRGQQRGAGSSTLDRPETGDASLGAILPSSAAEDT